MAGGISTAVCVMGAAAQGAVPAAATRRRVAAAGWCSVGEGADETGADGHRTAGVAVPTAAAAAVAVFCQVRLNIRVRTGAGRRRGAVTTVGGTDTGKGGVALVAAALLNAVTAFACPVGGGRRTENDKGGGIPLRRRRGRQCPSVTPAAENLRNRPRRGGHHPEHCACSEGPVYPGHHSGPGRSRS